MYVVEEESLTNDSEALARKVRFGVGIHFCATEISLVSETLTFGGFVARIMVVS